MIEQMNEVDMERRKTGFSPCFNGRRVDCFFAGAFLSVKVSHVLIRMVFIEVFNFKGTYLLMYSSSVCSLLLD